MTLEAQNPWNVYYPTDHRIRPYTVLKSESIRMTCKRCLDESLVLTFGKGGRQMCMSCDAKKLARHVVQFNECVARFAGT
jgi:hypothetical protein